MLLDRSPYFPRFVPLKFPKTIPLPPATVQWILKLKVRGH
ncbi:BnaC09g52970D [Brassica napus]|uniref:BnaC09g52970D protein n=1 Tax=Brassica napus TaxID=3708 RepID=A0A078J142_BRANA|nr:BnaC09g52970D [Brassica napus]